MLRKPSAETAHAERIDRPLVEQNARDLADDRYAATSRWFWVSSVLGSIPLATLMFAAVPTYGWIPFLVIGLVGVVGSFGPLTAGGITVRLYTIGHVGFMVGIGLCVMLTGGATSFLLALVPPLVLGFFSRLRPNLATAYAWLSFVLANVPVVALDWDGIRRFPWMLGAGAVGMVTLTLFARQMAAGELRHQGEATIDQLTGLLNRRGLQARLDELVAQAVVLSDETQIALVACDLDHFKLINDTFGHARGDDVLRDVAYLMRKQLRRFELAYRLGGEEFLIVLPGHDRLTAYGLAEAIRSSIEHARPGGVDVTMSIGVASCAAAGADPVVLHLAADTALYEAKSTGRNRIVLAPEAGGPAVLPSY